MPTTGETSAAALADEGLLPGLHVKARAAHPRYPPRYQVEDALVPWSVPAPDYDPIDFVAPVVLKMDMTINPQGWADPATPDKALIESRGSYELARMRQSFIFDSNTGRPLNPHGRTGMCNRGVLGKWGANFAADPIVTRYNPNKQGKPLEMVAIKRKDTGEWAIPGGMVDPGEVVSVTLKREFTEEAGNVSESERPRFEALTQELFDESNGQEVYRGYVDDPRNTDNSWMETVAMHFHCKDELAEMLMLHAGDDAAEVQWLEVGDHEAQYCKLYASHKHMVDQILLTHNKFGDPASVGAKPPAERRRV